MLMLVLIVRKELLYFCRRHYPDNSEDLTYVNIYANINMSGGGVMELVRWKNYSVYFFDEERSNDYVGDFIDTLYEKDSATAARILNLFIKRLAEGKGVTQECYDQHLKGIASFDIFEYRDKSTLLKKQIRIYFGAHGQTKTLVFVCAGFKGSKAEQKRDIDTAKQRYMRYISRF